MTFPNKYIVFAWDEDLALGGLEDIIASCETREEAVDVAREEPWDYWIVVDRDTWETIAWSTHAVRSEL